MNATEIRKLRLKLGWSQQKFATKLNVGIATVARWELGIAKPSNLANEKLLRLLKSTR